MVNNLDMAGLVRFSELDFKNFPLQIKSKPPVLILEQIGLYFFPKVLNSCYVWPNPDLCNANIICMYTLYNKSDFRAVEKLEFLDYIYINILTQNLITYCS